jgi:hypothetical protein
MYGHSNHPGTTSTPRTPFGYLSFLNTFSLSLIRLFLAPRSSSSSSSDPRSTSVLLNDMAEGEKDALPFEECELVDGGVEGGSVCIRSISEDEARRSFPS